MEPLEDRRMLALPHAVGGFDQGLLHTEADFARMANNVAAQQAPWQAGWQALQGEGYASLNTAPRPLETVIRGGADNYAQMHIDIQRAYLLAVQWKVTGSTAYADKAVEYLNAWKDTMTNLTGDSNVTLAAGIYGYQWANVAEIMRTYSGWQASDAEEFGDWLALHFAGKSSWFLANHYGRDITHYWANWDLASIASLMAIGIYNDDLAMYNEALDYFYGGAGNGGGGKWVYYVHDGNLGQMQESGRDQGHTTLVVSLTGAIMQMAWNQHNQGNPHGADLFAYDNNRFAAGVEYVSKYNLWHDVPFEQYAWGPAPWYNTTYHDDVSPAARGVFRPGWELVYNHYTNIKGIDLPWTEKVIDTIYNGVEGWSRNGDQFGFGTLTYSLDPLDVNDSKPSGLTAVNYEAGVKLNWWGAAYADSHNVYRATSQSGPFTQIASGVTDLLTYVDHTAPGGEYWYKVTGVIDGAETDFSNTVRITNGAELVTHLEFNENGGTTAGDSTGNGVNGSLMNGAAFVPGKSGNAVDLSGGNQYVSLPADVTEDLSDFTIATWVRLDSVDSWSRIFDFGGGTERYMFLTPSAGGGGVRFTIATNYFRNEDVLEGPAPLQANQWTHVAVTLSGTTGRLYVNGQLVDANTEMNLNPTQMRSTHQNWIGRSQYSADAYLNGRVDDFRIYNGALTSGDVYQLATGAPPPAAPATPSSIDATAAPNMQINLSWSATPSNSYTVKRSQQPGGPFYTIATQISGTTYSDTGLVQGQTYHYVVTADNAGGQSAPTSVASATALPPLPGTPTGLNAAPISSSEILLSWNPANDADTYNVQRAAAVNGPYEVIASGLTDTEFVDSELPSGEVFFYTVTAVNEVAESSPSIVVTGNVSDLVAWLRLDEADFGVTLDASGNGAAANLFNNPQIIAGRIGNGLSFDGVDDYASLPAGVVSGLTDFTIATWVYLDSKSNWARVFDFGSGQSTNMFLTPANGANGRLRFAIKSGGGAEQQINTSVDFPTQQWTHVAVTLAGGVGILYMDGAEVGRNNAMSLSPASLGSSTQNYLGRSQYPDPYLDGALDDLRIYNRALPAADLLAMSSPSNVPGDYNQDNTVNAADYTVYRDALGSTAPAFSGADGNGDGRIDRTDYLVWRDHYGQTYVPDTPDFLLPADETAPAVANDRLFSDYAAPERPLTPTSQPVLSTDTAAPDGELALLLLLDASEPLSGDSGDPSTPDRLHEDTLQAAFAAELDETDEFLAPLPGLRR